MKSIIGQKLNGEFQPIALLRSNEKPNNALEIEAGMKGYCMMGNFARVVAEGKTALFSKNTCGCTGAEVALGFGNAYLTAMPGGADTYAAFFSKGMEDIADKEKYLKLAERMDDHSREKFIKGERLHASKEKALRWITELLPIYDYPEKYAILKPISELKASEVPQSVIFTVKPIELSMLIILAGTTSYESDEIIAPSHASGCQTFANYVFAQDEEENPHAVLGLLDLASREPTLKWIPEEYLTYSIPWKMYQKMEEAAAGDGIFNSPIWERLQNRIVNP